MADEGVSGGPLSGLEGYLGKVVVIDTKSSYVFIGRFAGVQGEYFVLEEADAHDCSQGRANKDLYIVDARRYGFHPNRERVVVKICETVSMSEIGEVSE